MSEQDQSVRMM